MTMRLAFAILCLTTLAALAQPPRGVQGYWREPTGSVIQISACGHDLCAAIAALSPRAEEKVDTKNPDPAARNHPLCGLRIGYGFHLIDPTHADGGRLYDPKSGKTYKGTMAAEANQLHLRGYIGIKAFGRSETWTRTDRSAASCTAGR